MSPFYDTLIHEMETSDTSQYVAGLERHICRLQQILREWTPYVPQHIIMRSQLPLEIDTTHLPQPPVPLDPSVSQCRKLSVSGSSSSEETWRKPLRTFINRIPSAEKWSGIVSHPRVSVLDLLFQIDTRLCDGESTSLIQYQHSDVIMQTLGAYASLTQRCANNVKWATFIASYQKFLLGALCHVACCLGKDPKSVDKMMGFISKGGPDHLQELRHGAAWGVEAIDRLQRESDWDIRSGDILFYFTPTFTSLRYWAKANKSMPTFITSLKGDQYTKSPVGLHSNHLSVPCIIKCIFGKSVRLSDVCKVLHCNFDIARKSFAKWYLEPFGSDVMDDSERQRLFSPMTQFTLHGEADYRTEIQIGRDSQPKRGSLREAQKRRRISSGTSSNLEEDLSPIPNLSASAQVQTTLDECPEHSLLNQSDQERDSLTSNASSEMFPQQMTRDQRLLLANPDPACSLPQDGSHPRHLYLTGPPDFADVETLSYSLPSFNAISEIPILPGSGFSATQETAALPSTSLDYCIPSFSYITGIPSPEQ